MKYVKCSGTNINGISLIIIGSNDALPIPGHLGKVERMVKPA